MKNESLDFRKVLHAAEIVRQQGVREEYGDYVYKGIRYNSGHDGYSITLSDREVALTVNFHNTTRLDSPSRSKTEAFYKHLDRIIREDTE